MACRCIDMKNCINDILKMKEIEQEFRKLERNIQGINESLSKMDDLSICIDYSETELINNFKNDNMKLIDKAPLIINECSIKIRELEKQYELIMNEDNMYHEIKDN